MSPNPLSETPFAAIEACLTPQSCEPVSEADHATDPQKPLPDFEELLRSFDHDRELSEN